MTSLRLISVSFVFLSLTGCAMLGLSSDDSYENDPVAQAAIALRSNRGPASSLASSENTISSQQPNPGQLTLGMTMPGVRSLWGEPQEIETAGTGNQDYQRWIYHNGLARGWGTSDSRVVYFEQGRVAGWENHR